MRHTRGAAGIVGAVHILLATDADWIVDEVTAALGGPDTSFTVCRDGRAVAGVVADREPDLAVLDLQVGSMGGMAIAKALRLDETGGSLPHVPIMMLLDRHADVFLAQRSEADGWLVKPLDALRLKRCALAVVAGEPFTEGVPDDVVEATSEPDADDEGAESEDAGTPEEESATAG
jgi:DNA-binding response OmpR family regulator